MSLRDRVERYVALKRHLGWKFVNNERLLLAFATFAMAHGDRIVRAETAIRWAGQSSSPAWARRRLCVVRRFAVWLRSEDDRHEIPARDALGRAKAQRHPPHLLTDAEVSRLMAAALRLPPPGSMTHIP